MSDLDEKALSETVNELLSRWPSAGLAVGVVLGERLAWFHGQGFADVGTRRPVTPDTVFRVGSLTKTFTAIAVMQLVEQGLVDLDAPANDYLSSFRLTAADGGFRPATVRHLLTHTAGIGYWRRFSDLLRPGIGSGVRAGRSLPALPDFYRRGLPVEVEPGTKWVYSNHGFAALGQLVEDVTGQPIDRYLRGHLFHPLRMEHTDLVRSDRLRGALATGYVLGSHGLRAVADRDVPALGAGAAYSTTADMARYVAALLGGPELGGVLRPLTVASMFEPHFQPDARLPGMGLGFLLGAEGDRRTVGHDGIVSGFLSQMTMAVDDRIGVLVFSNTGGLDGRGTPEPLGVALLRQLLGLSKRAVRTDLPPHPEVWRAICGWYSPDPGPVTNLFTRAFLGAGAEVRVRAGQLMLEPLTPVPALRKGIRMYPDSSADPYLFRVDFSNLGKGTLRVVFSGFEGASASPSTAGRLMLDGISLRQRSNVWNPRFVTTALLSSGAVLTALRYRQAGKRNS